MARQVNHRGWFVLVSIESDDRAFCVDIFEDTEGHFGFEHFRTDVEDRGAWTPIGGHSSQRHETAESASEAAQAAIGWLNNYPSAKESLDRWREQLAQDQ